MSPASLPSAAVSISGRRPVNPLPGPRFPPAERHLAQALTTDRGRV